MIMSDEALASCAIFRRHMTLEICHNLGCELAVINEDQDTGLVGKREGMSHKASIVGHVLNTVDLMKSVDSVWPVGCDVNMLEVVGKQFFWTVMRICGRIVAEKSDQRTVCGRRFRRTSRLPQSP
jgi:hypothetical protein